MQCIQPTVNPTNIQRMSMENPTQIQHPATCPDELVNDNVRQWRWWFAAFFSLWSLVCFFVFLKCGLGTMVTWCTISGGETTIQQTDYYLSLLCWKNMQMTWECSWFVFDFRPPEVYQSQIGCPMQLLPKNAKGECLWCHESPHQLTRWANKHTTIKIGIAVDSIQHHIRPQDLPTSKIKSTWGEGPTYGLLTWGGKPKRTITYSCEDCIFLAFAFAFPFFCQKMVAESRQATLPLRPWVLLSILLLHYPTLGELLISKRHSPRHYI